VHYVAISLNRISNQYQLAIVLIEHMYNYLAVNELHENITCIDLKSKFLQFSHLFTEEESVHVRRQVHFLQLMDFVL
jgi:hypothetical protein